MPKTSLDPQTIQSLKRIFIESLNGKDTLAFFGSVKLASGKAVIAKPDGVSQFKVLITQEGATPSGYTYSVEYWLDQFVIHSSDSGDTAEISYLIIGN